MAAIEAWSKRHYRLAKVRGRGYSPGQQAPDYRRLQSWLAAKTNGYVPAGWGQLMKGFVDLPSIGIDDLPMPIAESISTVLSNIEGLKNSENTIYHRIDEASEFGQRVRTWAQTAKDDNG